LLRHDLDWEGFGQIGPGLYAHPTPDISALEETLGEHRTRARITTFSARALHGKQEANLKDLASRSWALDSLARQYRDFLKHFEPLRGRLSREPPTPEQCFILRTLLIHEFRRVQLRDPQLPPVLLPEDWPGVSARNLCREIYFATAQGAEQHLIESAETPTGALRPAAPYFFERFGGLTRQARSA
jgi:phenylacetic acid degradation operon negative regulatory protein